MVKINKVLSLLITLAGSIYGVMLFISSTCSAVSYPQSTITPLATDLSMNQYKLVDVGDIIAKGPWVDVRAYASLSDAISAIGLSQVTLIITSDISVSSAITVPGNIHIFVLEGGSFTKSGSGSLNIQGSFDASLKQVFNGFSAGNVTFNKDKVLYSYPQWFGTGTTAVLSAASTGTPVGIIGTVGCDVMLNLPDSAEFVGLGSAFSTLNFTFTSTRGITLANNNTFRMIKIKCSSASAYEAIGSTVTSLTNLVVDQCEFENFAGGVNTYYIDGVYITNNVFVTGSGFRSGASNAIISGNIINNVNFYDDGIFILGSSNNTNTNINIVNNIIKMGNRHGITLSHSSSSNGTISYVVIANNIINNTSGSGIHTEVVNGSINHITIVGNTIKNSTTESIMIEADDIIVAENDCDGAISSYGINVTRSNRVLIKGNIVQNCKQLLIANTNNTDITTIGNIGKQLSDWGILQTVGVCADNILIDTPPSNYPVLSLSRFVRAHGNIASRKSISGLDIIDGSGELEILNGKVIYHTSSVNAPPTSGTWERGDRKVFHGTVSAGEYFSWICISGGTPGTWNGFGNIDLSGTLVWDPPSLSNGTGATSPGITVTGASIGDYVIVGAPYDLQGIVCTGYVSANNTVNIRLQNGTGSSKNLSSGTWKVRIMK